MAETVLHAAFSGLAAIIAMAAVTWVASLVRRDVSVVDSLWSVFITSAGAVYAWQLPATGARPALMLALAVVWALRLTLYITWRNHGQPEDRRYQQIRARNQPHFEMKSLYLIFGLQALLAWIVSAPFLAGMRGPNALNVLDLAGAALAAFGIVFEAVGDQQMARFKADAANKGQVMDRGVWRFTRHPNYFGECCVWWGLFAIALAAGGAWWSVVSPLLVTFLLLKVSGVSLLEADIGERRPAYRDYIARTNAFFPGPPRRKGPA
jgi:steroid 5-alpha reductase family enzyme